MAAALEAGALAAGWAAVPVLQAARTTADIAAVSARATGGCACRKLPTVTALASPRPGAPGDHVPARPSGPPGLPTSNITHTDTIPPIVDDKGCRATIFVHDRHGATLLRAGAAVAWSPYFAS